MSNGWQKFLVHYKEIIEIYNLNPKIYDNLISFSSTSNDTCMISNSVVQGLFYTHWEMGSLKFLKAIMEQKHSDWFSDIDWKLITLS